MRAYLIAGVVVATLVGTGRADSLLFEDFEGSLSQWVGKGDGPHHGLIVNDPFNSSNNVLVFSELNAAGDLFSAEVTVSLGEWYVLSFNYLGYPQSGSPPGSFGGFIGIADETTDLSSATVLFLAGTCDEGNILIDLVDDGAWHSYAITFNPYDHIEISDGAVHVTIEDWIGELTASCPRGVPGDAFFDNIILERSEPIAAEATTWGKVKALYR